MQKYLLIFGLTISGCGAAQHVVECTVQDSHVLADDLATAIWADVKAGRRTPSERLTGVWAGFLTQFSAHAVRCSLEELIRKWQDIAPRNSRYQIATSLAMELRDAAEPRFR